jgi:hypothetical protein
MMPTRNARRQRWCSSRRGGRTGRAGVDAGGGTPRGNRANICGRWRSHLSWARPDCMAGHVGLELRNVDANYPFERSHRFAGIQPNSGQGDHSRLSCGVGDTQLGAGFCRDFEQAFCTDLGHHAASPRRHELAAISFVQKMIRRRQSQQHHCSVCAGLSAQRERVW